MPKRKFYCSTDGCFFETVNYRSLCNHSWIHNKNCDICRVQCGNLKSWKKHIKTSKHNNNLKKIARTSEINLSEDNSPDNSMYFLYF